MRSVRLLAAVLLSFLGMLWAGVPASAGGRFIETGVAGAGATNVGGPVLAGDALVWTESRGPGRSRWRLVRLQDDGVGEIEAYAGGAHTVTPVASSEAVAVYRERAECIQGRHGCEGPPFAAFGEVRAGDLTSGTRVLASCPALAACPIGPIGVGGAATGWVQAGMYRVVGPGFGRDLALGDDFAEDAISQAGDYVALLRTRLPSDPVHAAPPVSPGVTVFDVRRGAVAYELGVAVTHAVVRSDGLLVGVSADNTLFWASAAEPQPHPFAQLAGSGWGLGLKVRGDAVAVVHKDTSIVSVYRLSGERVAAGRLAGARSLHAGAVRQDDPHWDFDGSRLVYAIKPCWRTTIVEWDLQDAPPNRGERCTAPRVHAARVRFVRPDRVRIALSCPSGSRGGCGLALGGDLEDGAIRGLGGDEYLLYRRISLDPGQRRSISLRLSKYVRSWLSVHPRAVLRLDILGAGTRTVRVRPRWPAWLTLPYPH